MNKIVISDNSMSLKIIIESGLIESIHILNQAMPEYYSKKHKDIYKQFKLYLRGETVRFDLKVNTTQLTDFQRNVFKYLIKVPSGSTTTYGELARLCASPRHSRAVAQALKHNPLPIYFPCHRVVATHHIGGFNAPGGILTKQKLLLLEGVTLEL